MPDFVYTDDEPRTYLAFGEVERGSVVTADEAPDHRFEQVVPEPAAAKSAPAKTKAAPAASDNPTTEA